jgi:outer membrane biosynthesis protein TonB
MRFSARSVAWLLPLLLTACVHKAPQSQSQSQPLAPPIEDTPPQKPDNAPVNLPPPVITVPQTPAPTATTQEQPPPPPPKRKKQPSKTTTQQAAAPQPVQQASNSQPEESAVGKLSSGEPPDLHKQTADSIAEIERGLNGISRKLSDQEQKTSAQIREFLKQAKTALASDDVDGAHTLAVKAKVLLDELNQ